MLRILNIRLVTSCTTEAERLWPSQGKVWILRSLGVLKKLLVLENFLLDTTLLLVIGVGPFHE